MYDCTSSQPPCLDLHLILEDAIQIKSQPQCKKKRRQSHVHGEVSRYLILEDIPSLLEMDISTSHGR